jgi:hypothetical protein
MAMGEFHLQVTDFVDVSRWRWRLTTSDGRMLAEHRVRLNPGCWQIEAVADLASYLRWHVVPDRRRADEATIVADVGEWLGEHVLGSVGPALLRERPVTVRLLVPDEAQRLMFWPFQLAHVNGTPIAAQQVTLVLQRVGSAQVGAADVDGRLRVLGLFSLPTGSGALNLRRERVALVRLFSGIAGRGRAVEVRVLQYGVTRERLSEVLAEPEGWDLIHISGHGAPGELLLETDTGGADPIDAGDLATMLRAARGRLQLVTLSACWSAAVTDLKHALDLPDLDDPDHATEREPAPALATGLLDQLGCAVLAMRYPVTDDFAIQLAEQLYTRLAGDAQPMPDALAASLTDLIPAQPTATRPAISVATPALFGASAVNLRLAAPSQTGSSSAETLDRKIARVPFEAPPDRFVGRVAVMARASAALAPRSGCSGVLFHGMPGGGKTACAAELAHTHEHAFERLVWFKPDEDHDVTDVLIRFASTLETILPDVQLVHLLDDTAQLNAYLPRLTELCARRRLLITLDNIESLLTGTGDWRDDRWTTLIDAVTGHDGPSRLVLTSRRLPARLDVRMRVEAIDALTLDEALLLARELPQLGALIDGTLPGLDPKTSRRLALAVLDAAQGHPTMLELANGQAADPAGLTQALAAADRAWTDKGGLPAGFFTTGSSTATGTDYLKVLRAWAGSVANGLPDVERIAFWWLCCMEENDRHGLTLKHTWADAWERSNRADGPPPDVDSAVAALAKRGLVTILPTNAGNDATYGVHPEVATVGRMQAGERFRETITVEMAVYWKNMVKSAEQQEETAATGQLVVRAGLAAIPYLMRVQQWKLAAQIISRVLHRDHSRATVGAVLPALQRITSATRGTSFESSARSLLAEASEKYQPGAATPQLRALLESALSREDYWSAAVVTPPLIRNYRRSGRLNEALKLAEEEITYTRRAGLGPWTQLLAEAQRLQVLKDIGNVETVLAEVSRLRTHMAALPETSDEPEATPPWNARELLLGAGAAAAVRLGRPQEALGFDDAVIASKRARGAPQIDIASTLFNTTTPLISLGHLDQAEAVLHECRDAFEDAQDFDALGTLFDALASIEDRRKHGTIAIRLQKDALRYKYLSGNVDGILTGHHNLGHILHLHAAEGNSAVAHHLVAALLSTLIGTERQLQAVAADIVIFGEDCITSIDLTELCGRVDALHGVHANRLLDHLAPNRAHLENTLAQLIAQAQALSQQTPPPGTHNLALWDPMIAALLASDLGDANATREFRQSLARIEESEGYTHWAALIYVMRQIQAGHRDPAVLKGLDVVHRAIAERAINALAGRVTISPELWRAIPLQELLCDLVDAARGNAEAATRVRQDIEILTNYPDWSNLAKALQQIADGARDPALANTLTNATERAAFTTVLHHITTSSAGAVVSEGGVG